MRESVLYYERGRVSFIQNVGENPKVRTTDYLGHLADELEDIGSCSFMVIKMRFLFSALRQENVLLGVKFTV